MPSETFAARREATDEEIVLGLLGAVERNPGVTQRSAASELGIALGLVNAHLKRCIRDGLVAVGHGSARRYTYYLTARGSAEKSRLTASYLAHSFAFFRQARAECDALIRAAVEQGQRRLVLLGAGELAEITVLAARAHPVAISGVFAASADPKHILAIFEEGGAADAAIVTALSAPGDVFAAAVAALGSRRVHAPPLLRLPAPPMHPVPENGA